MKDQTDTEINEIIAVKVMGLDIEQYRTNKGDVIALPDYLNSDADCMMAWDEFAKKQRADIGRWMDDTDWVWEVCAWEWCEISQEHVIKAISENPDRRRAMCECMAQSMAKAVS